ncbi:MAG: hypothetical protein PHF37_06475 [Phycisphaerae bacterium]|nr:hypothetical protein [Phycisphaerae bacterium]
MKINRIKDLLGCLKNTPVYFWHENRAAILAGRITAITLDNGAEPEAVISYRWPCDQAQFETVRLPFRAVFFTTEGVRLSLLK